MTDRLILFRLAVLGLLTLGLLLIGQRVLLGTGQTAALGAAGSGDGFLTVVFLDVGQGDAIYIETPDGVQLLIDGGADTAVLRELPKYMPLLDRSLDVVLATHPDLDHIGGLVDVLARYDVANIIRTENNSDTAVAGAFAEAVVGEGGNEVLGQAGLQIALGASTTLRVFSPTSDPRDWESNTSSLVVQLKYGEIEFMLTGDAPKSIEEYLVGKYGGLLASEVLKLGHHGSKTSTAEIFLQAVDPDFAVVSSGLDNRYGHPHAEVMALVKEEGVTSLNTAEAGTIVFKSDGERVWLK